MLFRSGSSSKSAYENGTRTLLHDQSTQLTASDWTNPYQYPPSGSSTKYADDYLSEASVYTLTTTGSFSYYVIEASATSGNTTYCGLGELEFFGDVIATNDRLIKGLRMDLSTDGTNWTTVSDGTNTNTSYVVTGLTNGQKYFFRVAAVNTVQGPYSDQVTGTPTGRSLKIGRAHV